MLGSVTLTPSFVYGADAGATLTNSSLFETPGTQSRGIYSTSAAKRLPQLQVPHIFRNYLNGLILSNDAAIAATNIDIAAGEAADSTNSTVMELPGGCNVDLATAGEGGLDTAAGIVANQTYFYYLIANPGGLNPGCLASTSPIAPAFNDPSFTGTNFQSVQPGTMVSGFTIYNVGSIVGAAVGDPIVSTTTGYPLPANSTIASFTTSTTNFLGATWSMSSYTINFVPSGAYPGMQIADLSNSCIPPGDTVASVSSSSVTITPAPTTCANVSTGSTVQLSGGNEIVFTNPTSTPVAVATPLVVNLTIYTGLHRMIGALYSNGLTSPSLVAFSQNNDTFYLKNSAVDIDTAIGKCPGISPIGVFCTLSVPKGIKVEAFGRVVGGASANQLLLTSFDQLPQTPTGFPGPPGFTTNNNATRTSFPFDLYTGIGGNIRAQSATGTLITTYGDTDGWLLRRSQ
jgi:hypothetical protein